MPSARVHACGIGLVAAIGTAVAASARGQPLYVVPIKALMFGAFGVVGINVVVYSVNLLSSMRQWRHSRTEEQLADLAIPAMRGELKAVGPRMVRISTFLLATCFGIIAGAIVALLIDSAA